MANVNDADEKNPPIPEGWGVWAEINYLDSATEYREYLPAVPIQKPRTRVIFVPRACQLHLRGRTWALRARPFVVFVLIARYSLYSVMNHP